MNENNNKPYMLPDALTFKDFSYECSVGGIPVTSACCDGNGLKYTIGAVTVAGDADLISDNITLALSTQAANMDDIYAKEAVRKAFHSGKLTIDDYCSGLFTLPKIKKVIYNPPATIIIWDYDELNPPCKTVVKCSENDIYSKEVGFAMAVMKKLFGNDNTFHKLMKKYVK